MNEKSVNYMEIFRSIDFDKIIDHPNILIAANFWDTDRYHAAKTCYKLMRAIDDMVDDYKSQHVSITSGEKENLKSEVEIWIGSITEKANINPLQKEISDTFSKFCIPLWPMKDFATSMIYDICHDGFPTLQSFLDYSMGASVAPASVFVHLCGIKMKNGQYVPPAFDVRNAATPCAIFSYLIHIIRDFQKDQFNHLNYFADDMVEKYGLDRKILSEIAKNGKPTDGFRGLVNEYLTIADEYRRKTFSIIEEIKYLLDERYQLSLEIIFNLYLMVFERIDSANCNFTMQELNPSSEEIKQRVLKTITEFRPVR